MAMQAPAFVILRNVWKVVRGLKGKGLEYFHGINQLRITK
jgi:hypothetical protein